MLHLDDNQQTETKSTDILEYRNGCWTIKK